MALGEAPYSDRPGSPSVMKRALHSRAARWTQGVLASTCRANSDVRPARLRSQPAEMHIAFQRPLISYLLASSARQGT